MRSLALALILLLPDRLPSLIVLVGFWIPPAVAGWVAAEFLQRSSKRVSASLIFIVLAAFVLAYATVWFFFTRPHAAVHSGSNYGSNVRAAAGRHVARHCRECFGVARQRSGVRAGVSLPQAYLK
jgi:hypothetical protein